MDATLTPARRGDSLDAEMFGEMVSSGPFKLLLARIRAELGRVQETCVRSDVELEIRRAQGAVKAFETVLSLPEIMAAEMKAGPRYVAGSAKARIASNSRP